MIKVENLTKRYGDHVALDGVTFTVKEGHIYGLLGPNGAGKSTTMNLITGYIVPTAGSVTVDGFNMGKDPMKAKKSIGYLPEIPPLYPDMTVKEYLSFVADLKKVPKSEKQLELDRVMGLTHITDMQKRLIKHLSKGYKQRVGIAQALLGSPKVIILDEPTVGLDPEQIIEIRDLIKSLKGRHTVILSSHILSEISAVCEEVLMIAKGKVVAMDTTENILKMSKTGQKLDVILKGSADKIEETLKGLSFVKDFEKLYEDGEKCTYEITATEEKEDIREELSFALSDARILIIEMKSFLASLEDIYLEIIQDTKASSGISFVESETKEETTVTETDEEAEAAESESENEDNKEEA